MGFSALEMALRERYCAENPIDLDKKRKKKIMLHDLIKHAEKRWLVNNTFPSLHSLGKNIETQSKLFESHAGKEAAEVLQGLVKDSIVACSAHSIRNDLAHGSKTLHPNSIATLSMIAEFINQIYS